jgi:hypothetical protein
MEGKCWEFHMTSGLCGVPERLCVRKHSPLKQPRSCVFAFVERKDGAKSLSLQKVHSSTTTDDRWIQNKMDLFDDPGAYFDAELVDENNDLRETLFAETVSYSLGLGLVCRCPKQLLVFSSPARKE